MPIIFDFDGVIANTLDLIVKHARASSLSLECQCDVSPEDIYWLEPMEYLALAKKIGIPESLQRTFVDKILSSFLEESPSPIFNDIENVIIELSRKTKLGIVSSTSEKVISQFLDYYNLAPYFQSVLGYESGKNKIERLQMTAQTLKTSTDQLYLVGDASSDIIAAREAGAKSIAVTWGNQHPSLLTSKNPDYTIDSPQQLLTLSYL